MRTSLLTASCPPTARSLRRSRRSALACASSSSEAAPSALLLPPPTSASVQALLTLHQMGDVGALDYLFTQTLLTLAHEARRAALAPPSDDLSARIATLRALEERSLEVAELLAFTVGRRLADCGAALRTGLPLNDAPQEEGRVTPETLQLLLLDQPDALAELLAHVDAAIPPTAPESLLVRLDAVSGGRLYAGSVQFGYFVRTFFLRTDLSSRIPEGELRRMAQSMRSRQAWTAATARAAALWGLECREDVDSFSTRVTVVPSSATAEFYASEGSADDDADGKKEKGGAKSLIPLSAGGLRGLLAEAMMWGWVLKREEERLESDGRLCAEGLGLLTPPETRLVD